MISVLLDFLSQVPKVLLIFIHIFHSVLELDDFHSLLLSSEIFNIVLCFNCKICFFVVALCFLIFPSLHSL